MMMTDVPPNETLAPKKPVHITGINATIKRPTLPINNILLRILLRYSVVHRPGVIPGITPPALLRLSAICNGLNVIDV